MALAINRGYGFHFEYLDEGGPAPMREVQFDTDQTLAVGDAMKIGSDGYGEIATSGGPIFGFVQKVVTADNATRPKALVIAASRSAVFSGRTGTATVGSVALVGDEFSITGATGAMEINEAVTTVFDIVVIAKHPMSTAWGSNTQLLFKVTDSQYAGTGA